MNVTSNASVASDEALSHLRHVVFQSNRYVMPVIVLTGLIGNALSFAVFKGTYLRRLSLSVYLAALAVSDSTFLLSLFAIWLEFIHFPVVHTTGLCQLVVYLSFCSSFLSVWIVVSLSVERYIAICHPLRRPEMCTSARARYVVGALIAFTLVAYSHELWTTGVAVFKGSYHRCTPLERFRRLHTVVGYTDTVLTFIVPFVLLVALNVTIAYRIAYFYRRRGALMRRGTGRHEVGLIRTRLACQEKPLCTRAQVQVTKMLFFLCSVFILINLPSYALRIRIFVISFFNEDYEGTPQEFLFQQLFQLIYYANFSINFVVYCTCSTKFREAFRRLFWQTKYKCSRFIQRYHTRVFRRRSTSFEDDPFRQQPVPQPFQGRQAVL